MSHFGVIGLVAVISTLFVAGRAVSQAGVSFSARYDFLPYQTIDEPIEMEDGSFVDDAQVRLSRFRATLTYPVFFSQGRTILVNEISYQQIKFDYRKTTSLLNRLHSAGYSLMLYHQISEKWSVLAMGTSSLASDLKSDISGEDFSFQVASVLNRHFGQRFAFGLGVAYSTQFGSAVPMPLLSLDWNNGAKWSAKVLVPASLEVWYHHSQRLGLGLLLTGDGDNYRFDPGKYREVSPEPELRYTMMTIGVAGRVTLSKRICLNAESGVIGLHRFEFYSGDKEVVSNDLTPSHYVRLGLQLSL
jgi:hypothetical protein